MIKYLLAVLLPLTLFGQRQSFDKNLFESYDIYKEEALFNRRFKHDKISNLIDSLQHQKDIGISRLGHSIQGRSISMISLGNGEKEILLWSQMHGDESTATAAIFDIINYLKSNKSILEQIRVHFIPMLNPDGAELFNRRNAIGIDINRDALNLQSPESQILKRVRDSLNPDFGFNLHDQSKFYNAKSTNKPATISFLAPAFNRNKDINETRGNAMRVIVKMNTVLQRYIRGQVARYNDEFEPRAFGDNIQKWGTSTILIESGGQYEDPEKLEIRKLNFVSILSAFESIASESYKSATLDQYLSIPMNDRKFLDLKIENLRFTYLGQEFKVDLGIKHKEIENPDHSEFYYLGKVVDIGDLSNYYGYSTLDAEEFDFKIGKTHPKILSDFEQFKQLDYRSLLSQGYSAISIENMPPEIKFTPFPMNIIDVKNIRIPKNNTIPLSPLRLEENPSLILEKEGEVIYAIINGFIYHVKKDENLIKNAVVK